MYRTTKAGQSFLGLCTLSHCNFCFLVYRRKLYDNGDDGVSRYRDIIMVAIGARSGIVKGFRS